MPKGGSIHSSAPGAGGQDKDVALGDLSPFNALPYFAPLAIFPFVAAAAIHGGWWLAGPFIFLFLADQFDTALGTDERTVNPQQPEGKLFWFKLAVLSWVAVYPIVFIFAFRQVFAAEHLAFWEDVLIVLSLGAMARLTLNAGHDMMHRRTVWERRIGEFLMASVTFPQEITEHIYVHHAHIGTPKDAVSAPKGQSFWQYLPRSVFRSYLDTWRVEKQRVERRHVPVWHYTNRVWRYLLQIAVWYALAAWIGGIWGILVFATISVMGIFQLRMVDYMQHYGLQRVRLPNGRYERVQRHHSWSIAYKLSNWFYYNAQRHADHHIHSTRLYPLLKHSGPQEAPQLPGSYSAMGSLLMSPKRWFEKIDPLVDQWRTQFYPEVSNWNVYDSTAYMARPDAFEAIDEILNSSPGLSNWINHNPRLLDNLDSREFIDLDLPDGLLHDPQFGMRARRGLARVYWTHELDIDEIRARIADIPSRSPREAVETIRDWSNDRVFQLCVHVIRGNLSPVEAGIAASNITKASIEAVLSAIDEDSSLRLPPQGGLAVAVLGDLAGGSAFFAAELDIMFLCQSEPTEHQRSLYRSYMKGLQALTEENLLIRQIVSAQDRSDINSLSSLSDYVDNAHCGGSLIKFIGARRIFSHIESKAGEQFDQVRLDLLNNAATRTAATAELKNKLLSYAVPDLLTVSSALDAFRNVEHAARFLQITHAAVAPEILNSRTSSVFAVARKHGLLSADVAKRLETAAVLLKNLHGGLQLVVENAASIEAASLTAKEVIVRACEADNYEALTAEVFDTMNSVASYVRGLMREWSTG